MSKAAILLVGAGGHARACIDVIEQDGRFAIGGLLGLPQETGTAIFGYPVLGSDTELAALAATYSNALITVGQIKTPVLRMELFERLIIGGFATPVIVSPHAYVSRHAVVGDGSIVMHRAVINAGAIVGRNCIINSQALVEHDVVISDHCHIATGAILNSAVRVGRGSFIGSGSTVRQCVTIGEGCLIGMGQRILVDCDADTQIPPARRRR